MVFLQTPFSSCFKDSAKMYQRGCPELIPGSTRKHLVLARMLEKIILKNILVMPCYLELCYGKRIHLQGKQILSFQRKSLRWSHFRKAKGRSYLSSCVRSVEFYQRYSFSIWSFHIFQGWQCRRCLFRHCQENIPKYTGWKVGYSGCNS